MKKSLLCVGSIAFDDLEMPSGSFKDVLGGAATYSAIAASLLTSVNLVGIIGSDFDEAHLKMLRARGVDTEGVERANGKTFRWHGRYAPDLMSRESLDTQLNVFADFRPKIPASYKQTPYVLLGNIHPALQIEVLHQIERPRLVAADTMNFWISGEPKILNDMLSKIDLLVINDEEARQLSGIQNITKAAADIRKRGPKKLIIKRGEFGAMLFDGESHDDKRSFFVPGFPLEEVLDPTGAGDTFAGGLMGYIARHDDIGTHTIRRAMFFASALGSFCVEAIGATRVQAITPKDLAKRIDEFRSLVDYGGELSFVSE